MTDVDLWKSIPIDHEPHQTFPFPPMTDEIANEPTQQQMTVYKRSQRRIRWASRIAKLEAIICAFGQFCEDSFKAGLAWTIQRAKASRTYGKRVVHRPRHKLKRGSDVRYVSKSTPDNLRLYDEDTVGKHLGLSADDWARRMQAQISNSTLINSGAEGPMLAVTVKE